MPRQIRNIQGLRAVAALMVLAPHLKNYDMRFGSDQIGGLRFWELGNAGVDLFFVISGFVMVTVGLSRFGRPGEPRRFLLRRVLRIYPLFWFFSLLVLPIYLRHPDMVNTHNGSGLGYLLRSFALFPQTAGPLVAQGWTLIHEMYFYLVFALLLMLSESALVPLLLLWGAAVAIGSRVLPMTIPVFDVIANPLTLEFIAGCFIALLTHRRRLTRGGPALLLGVILLLALGAIHPIDLHSPWARVLYFGVPAMFIVLGSVVCEQAGKISPNWLVFTGDASYSIYLSQGLVLAAVARWAWHHVHAGVGSNIAVLSAMIFIALAVGYISFLFVERPLLRLTRARAKITPSLPATAVIP